MKTYTPDSPPHRGTAARIWRACIACGLSPDELHYNPNCWGKAKGDGWGTWAAIIPEINREGVYVGLDEQGRLWIQGMAAPYATRWPKPVTPEKPSPVDAATR